MGQIIGEGITFDDVLLVPAYSTVVPNEIDLRDAQPLKVSSFISFNRVGNVMEVSETQSSKAPFPMSFTPRDVTFTRFGSPLKA